MELSERDKFWLEVMREFEASEPKGAVENWRDEIFDSLSHLSLQAKEKWINRFGDTFEDVPGWLRDDLSTVWSKDPEKRETQIVNVKLQYHLAEMEEEYGRAPREGD